MGRYDSQYTWMCTGVFGSKPAASEKMWKKGKIKRVLCFFHRIPLWIWRKNEYSESDFEDEFVGQLQKSIHNVKESREMGERYMIFEEMMRDERKAGREEGALLAKRAFIFELLKDVGRISEELEVRIHELSDEEQLKVLHKLVAKAESIEDFEEKAKKVLA